MSNTDRSEWLDDFGLTKPQTQPYDKPRDISRKVDRNNTRNDGYASPLDYDE